jgi:hypothetical protein
MINVSDRSRKGNQNTHFMSNSLGLKKKRDEQRVAGAQMKFLRHLLGITKLDKEKKQSIRKK